MRKLVHYSGNVQGVGFRASAVWIARRHEVCGWVRNLADGRVELLADGSDTAVLDFLADVRDRMAMSIVSEDIAERDSDDQIDGFQIVG